MNNIELDTLRVKIDDIDFQLSNLLKERQSLASKIMIAKKGNSPFDPEREEKVIEKVVTFGLDKFLVEKIWRQIISSNLSFILALNFPIDIKSFGSWLILIHSFIFLSRFFVSVIAFDGSMNKCGLLLA